LWAVARGQLVSLHGALDRRGPAGTVHIADELVGAPAVSADGRRVALAHRGAGPGLSVLELVEVSADGGLVRRVLVADGGPDRVAISPSGEQVAWVDAGPEGFASVFSLAIDGGARVQLTNVGVVRTPGRAPEGFVPPPHDAPPRFEGGALAWRSEAGEHSVVLP
jgi:hypothetical protein